MAEQLVLVNVETNESMYLPEHYTVDIVQIDKCEYYTINPTGAMYIREKHVLLNNIR